MEGYEFGHKNTNFVRSLVKYTKFSNSIKNNGQLFSFVVWNGLSHLFPSIQELLIWNLFSIGHNMCQLMPH